MSRLEFVPRSEEIRVDIETGTMEFTTRPGTAFDRDELRRAVEDAGYAVHSISIGEEPAPVPSGAGRGSDGEASSPWWWPF